MATAILAYHFKYVSIYLCKGATLEAYQAFKLYIDLLSTANLGIYLRTSCQFTPRLQLYYTVNVPYFSFIISCLSSFVKNFFQLFLKYFFSQKLFNFSTYSLYHNYFSLSRTFSTFFEIFSFS